MTTARLWLVDVKKTALLACITGVAGIVPSVWNYIQVLREIGFKRPDMGWWLYPEMVATLIFIPILPVFLYALYLHEGRLRIRKQLGVVALVAAIAVALQTAWNLPAVIRYLGPWRGASVLDPQKPWTIAHLVPLINMAANLTLVLLLASLFRESTREPTAEVPSSRFLLVATKIAVIACGIWVAFQIFRLLATPFTYSIFRGLALQRGIPPPGLGKLMRGPIKDLVSQASIFVVPYVAYKSLSSQLDKPEACPTGVVE